MRNRYFVCYDVSEPRRLASTYKKMNGYGDPVQYSVFVCELNDKELIYLKNDLEELLDLNEDRVLVINTGSASNDRNVFTMGAQLSKSERVVVV